MSAPAPIGTVTPVEELREAARLMRERAEACVAEQHGEEEPWYTTGGHQFGVWRRFAEAAPMDAEYIVSMHPAVALAVADLLEQEADTLEVDHMPVWRDMLDDAGIAAHIEASKHFGPLFRLARAYLDDATREQLQAIAVGETGGVR